MVGNLRMIKEANLDLSNYQEKVDDYLNQGKTLVFLAQKDRVIGLVSIFDDIKETSRQAIERLKEMNIKTVMLTGDLKGTAQAINKN